MNFNAEQTRDEIVLWIRNWFRQNGPDCKAVVGISGGKDSSVVAALCVQALGADRVLGVMMPKGQQYDIAYSHKLVKHLGIDFSIINIGATVDAFLKEITGPMQGICNHMGGFRPFNVNSAVTTNLPARIRMATLYAVAACVNGRVANTCNLSEDYVGYATKFGDGAGDFSPLAHMTVTNVKKIGYVLGLPKELIEKTPEDGLSGFTDEDNLGFTYDVLDRFIETGVCEDPAVKQSIINKYVANRHKLDTIPSYKPVA